MPTLPKNAQAGIDMRHLYWDSCIYIYRVQSVAPWAQKIEHRIVDIPDFRLTITELTRLECLVLPTRQNDRRLLVFYEQIFASSIMDMVALERKVFQLATELRAAHRLKTPDALHLAAAISAGCDEFWTNDDRLATVAKGRIQVINVNSFI